MPVSPGFVNALSLGTALALPATPGMESNLTGVMARSVGGSVAMTTPSPSPTAMPVLLSGVVQHFDTNAPLSGIVRYVSHTLISSDTEPSVVPSDGGEAIASNGEFSMTVPAQPSYPARLYIEAFGPSEMATAHEILTVTACGTQTVDAAPVNRAV